MAEQIDPVRYGQLVQAVESLQASVEKLQQDVEELVALANRSRGGLFVMMSLSGIVGAAATWLAAHITWK